MPIVFLIFLAICVWIGNTIVDRVDPLLIGYTGSLIIILGWIGSIIALFGLKRTGTWAYFRQMLCILFFVSVPLSCTAVNELSPKGHVDIYGFTKTYPREETRQKSPYRTRTQRRMNMIQNMPKTFKGIIKFLLSLHTWALFGTAIIASLPFGFYYFTEKKLNDDSDEWLGGLYQITVFALTLIAIVVFAQS